MRKAVWEGHLRGRVTTDRNNVRVPMVLTNDGGRTVVLVIPRSRLESFNRTLATMAHKL